MQLDLPPEVELVTGEVELFEENEKYLIAWRELENIRPQGMTGIAGLIPSEIECWARYCWDLDAGEFVRRMLKVDAAVCQKIREIQAEKDAADKSKNGTK